MRVVVLATDSDSTWMVVNALRLHHPALQIGLEQPVSRGLLLRRRVARLGLTTVLGQLLFMLLCQPWLRRQGRFVRAQLIADAGLSTVQPNDLAVARFASVNTPACRDWLREQDPDVVVVNGTRIISAATLGACRAVFLNTHCGITPAYRGVHGGYWALAHGDAAHAGVTVHMVDKGVDTGDIVEQALISHDAQDNFLTYPVKQYVAAMPLLMRALEACAAGKLRTHQRSDLPSAIWYHPTIGAYLMNRWRRGIR